MSKLFPVVTSHLLQQIEVQIFDKFTPR